MNTENNIEIYKSKDDSIKINVNFDEDTVWLNLNQMSHLFGRDKSVISRHLKNIFKDELCKISVVAKNATITQNDDIIGNAQTKKVG